MPGPIVDALEPWRPVLANRAEIRRKPKRRWYETAWPRDKSQLHAPKVIALYRTDRGRFALDDDGAWQPSIKTTLVIPKGEDLSVAYLCGLLNSELLDLWYRVRGKNPRDIWRNYEPKPMAEIPYRHVEGIEHAASPAITKLEAALDAGAMTETTAIVAQIAGELGAAEPGSDQVSAAVMRSSGWWQMMC